MQNNPEYTSTVKEFTPWFSQKYGRNKHTFLLPGDSASLMGRLMLDEAKNNNLPLPPMKFLPHDEDSKLYYAYPSALDIVGPYIFESEGSKRLQFIEDFAFEADKMYNFKWHFYKNMDIIVSFVLMLATDFMKPVNDLEIYKTNTILATSLNTYYDRRH